MNRLITAAIVAGTSLVFASPVLAVDRYVDDSGTDAPGCTSPTAPCRTINFAVDQADPGDTVMLGAGASSYQESVTLDSGVSLVGSDFNPPATGPDSNQLRDIDGGLSFAVVVEPGTARNIEGISMYGGPGAIRVDTASGVPTTLTVRSDFLGDFFASNPDDGRLVLADGPAPINITIDDNSWPGVVNALVNRRAIDDIGSNPINATITHNSISAYSAPIRFTDADPLISDNFIHSYEDATPPDRAAIELTNSSATIERNYLLGDPFDGNSERGVQIDNTGPSVDSPALRMNRVLDFYRSGVNVAGSAGDNATVAESSFKAPGPAISASGGSVTAIGLTIFSSSNALELDDTNLLLDSSVMFDPIQAAGTSTCTIRYSRGPTTAGTPCQRFTTSADPGYLPGVPYDGIPHILFYSPMIDAGNPAEPGTTGLFGEARSQDGDGDGIAVRDMGAVELSARERADTLIESGPKPVTRSRKAVFFVRDRVSPEYELMCSLDGAPFTRCARRTWRHQPPPSLIYTQLEAAGRKGSKRTGKHTFAVYARGYGYGDDGDYRLYADFTPAVRKWTILPKKKRTRRH